MKGFILAGAQTGIGKTTISSGLMNLFENVSPFKSGPDFIDPTFHKFITGNPSYNLDLFLMGEDGVRYSFATHAKGISIIEGAMGLYDGIDSSLDNFSAAHLSRVLGLPVVLVIDGEKKGTSIAAEVLGFKNLDSRVKIIGVILNRVNSQKTFELQKEAIEKYTGIKCIGYLQNNLEFSIGSRHLGLLQAEEIQGLREKIDLVSQKLRENVDVDYILNHCETALEETILGKERFEKNFLSPLLNKYRGKKIAIAKDRAFSFYYEDNIELFKKLGIEVIEFSPMVDKEVPKADMLYFGGGYPENYLQELTNNQGMIESIKSFKESGKAILAECGGFIYMSQGIEDREGNFWELCGLADCEIVMGKSLDLGRFGYVNVDFEGKKGKAHEFHYSKIKSIGNMERKFIVSKANGNNWRCGYVHGKFMAGYPHFHLFNSIEILESILEG